MKQPVCSHLSTQRLPLLSSTRLKRHLTWERSFRSHISSQSPWLHLRHPRPISPALRHQSAVARTYLEVFYFLGWHELHNAIRLNLLEHESKSFMWIILLICLILGERVSPLFATDASNWEVRRTASRWIPHKPHERFCWYQFVDRYSLCGTGWAENRNPLSRDQALATPERL